MADNWVHNDENTQIDDDEDCFDNTQQQNNEEPTKKRKIGKTRASCWAFFKQVHPNGVRHGECHWCHSVIKADGKAGTSNLIKHAHNCKHNLDKKKNQTILQFQKEPNGEGSISAWKHDDKRIKKATTNLFVVGGLPFKFVENEAYIEYTNALNRNVVVPNRKKISKDVTLFYLEERNKLATFLANPLDSWTSDCEA
ncbi:hypothetical protein LXL04_007785 [Taraxacum kok-saghyz]